MPLFGLEKICFYLTVISGFFGSTFLVIRFGFFTIFPFRIALFMSLYLFMVRILVQGKLKIALAKVRRYMVFFLFWTVWAVISMSWSFSKIDAIRHLFFLVTGFLLIFFMAYYLSNSRDLTKLYITWSGIFCFLILVGLWEHITEQHLPVSKYFKEDLLTLAPSVLARVKHQPTGTFYNPNDYATYLALSIPIGLSLARYHRRRWVRVFGVATALLGGYLILVTESRASLLTVLLELGFLWFFLVRGVRRLKLAVTVAVAVTVALVLMPNLVQGILQSTREHLASIFYQMESESIYVRMNLIRNGLLFVYQTAGFGVGAGNAEHWMANFARYNTFGILNPHNWWLELLVDYGIFVFTGYLLFYFSVVRRLWKIHKHATGEWRMICEALLLSLVGFSIASVSSSSITAFSPQWMLFGFALAFLNSWGRQRSG